MGSRGLGDLGAFLLGSVSKRIKECLEVPVKLLDLDGNKVA
jgi:nucleotide-binding universal stress UspA family protein